MDLRRLPDVATISRVLGQVDADGVEQVRQLSRGMVLEGLRRDSYRGDTGFRWFDSIQQGPTPRHDGGRQQK